MSLSGIKFWGIKCTIKGRELPDTFRTTLSHACLTTSPLLVLRLRYFATMAPLCAPLLSKRRVILFDVPVDEHAFQESAEATKPRDRKSVV
mmetsp:Transcript_49865/g.92255  ORF Transcript_49865/g.92255 Transcript_49865/m.92255 type:complete len:91 (+) Transcript_49865:344-616(+)